MAYERGMPVMVTSKEVVKPSHHDLAVMTRLPFSNLDYVYPDRVHVSVYFCYAEPDGYDYHTMVDVLKDSLSRTLSSFLVFAGEIVRNSAGEPETLLSGRGVDFLCAATEMELRDIDLYRPDASVQGKLVPKIQHGLLAVQVTELRGGGVVLGLTFDHGVADAYSANMFLVSWSENALHMQTLTYAPTFDRSLLRPTHSDRPDIAAAPSDRWYMPVPRDELPRVLDDLYHHYPTPDDRFTSRMFYIEAETINRLQQQACLKPNGFKEGFRTKFEVFTAFLWKLLAKAAVNPTSSVKISMAVDGRTKMYNRTAQNAASMRDYFGNVISFPYTSATATALQSMSLSDAASLVHRCKVEEATSEHFSDVINWVESKRPAMFPGPKVYMEGPDDGAAVLVSSGQRFPVKEVEFGWGKASFASYYFEWRGGGGYVMPMPSAVRDGDWVVFMHLRKKLMKVVEKEGSHVFKPLNSTYLNN